MTKERLFQSIKMHWLKGSKHNYYMKKVFGGYGENFSYSPTILFNVRIGPNVIIGANSLVNKDLEGGYVYAGNPTKKACSFDKFVNKRINEMYFL